MEIIDEKMEQEAREMIPIPSETEKTPVLSEEEFNKMLDAMEHPVNAQKEMAVKIKTFLDIRIDEEMSTKGYLTDHTRRWVESYNNILDRIQKAIYGDKSVNLHVHKITHAQIAAKIRESF